MSKEFFVTIQICSNCKSHQWCTRHNQATYSTLAADIAKSIRDSDPSIKVDIFKVGGNRMGSFQIQCNNVLLFSKLSLGYFPHVLAVTTRIMQFIDDSKNGRDLKSYTENLGSPVRPNTGPGFTPKRSGSKSPTKKLKYSPDYRAPEQKSDLEERKQSQMNQDAKSAENNERKQEKQEQNQGFILSDNAGEQSVPPKVSIDQAQQKEQPSNNNTKEEKQNHVETYKEPENQKKIQQKPEETNKQAEKEQEQNKETPKKDQENKVQEPAKNNQAEGQQSKYESGFENLDSKVEAKQQEAKKDDEYNEEFQKTQSKVVQQPKNQPAQIQTDSPKKEETQEKAEQTKNQKVQDKGEEQPQEKQ